MAVPRTILALLGFAVLFGAAPATAQIVGLNFRDFGDRLEGDTGSSTSFTLGVYLNEPAQGAGGTVTYELVPDDAGGNFALGTSMTGPAGGTLTFLPGEQVKTLEYTIIGDDDFEASENYRLRVTNPTGSLSFAGITQWVQTGRIINDDPPPLVIDSPRVNEGAQGATTTLSFTVTLDTDGTDYRPAAEFKYRATGGGTATPGVDYVAPPGATLSKPEGTSSDFTWTIDVTVIDDNEYEFEETVEIEIYDAVVGLTSDAQALGAPPTHPAASSTGTGRIANDDPLPSFSIDSPSVAEGASGATTALVFTAMMSGPLPFENPVGWYTTPYGTATAGVDFEEANGTVTFAVGQTAATFTVTVIGNDIAEPDKTVGVGLRDSPASRIRGVSGFSMGTIRNDDVPVATLISPSVDEGDSGTTDLVFEVRLDQAPLPGQDVELRYQVVTESGTATISENSRRDPGEDYLDPTGYFTVDFTSDGPLEETFIVRAWGDGEIEPDETVVVANTLAVNAVGTATGTGVIRNDDFPELSIDSPSVDEGAAGATSSLTFTVSLSEPSFEEATVDWAVTDGTAVSGTDYQATAGGTVTIAAGAASATIPVTVIGNGSAGPDRTVEVTLSNPRKATLRTGGETGTGTILDDDLPLITIDSPSVVEGGAGDVTTMTFRVSMDADPGAAVRVDWDVTGGTATRGVDYRGNSGSLDFQPGGVLTQSVSIQIDGDELSEPDETVEVTLSNLTGDARFPGSATTTTGTGTIRNDDLPELSIDSPSVEEGDSGTTDLVFTVTLSQATGSPVTADWAVTGGMAGPGDYTLPAGRTLTIPAGSTTTTITAAVNGDLEVEQDETVTILLSNVSAGAELGTATGTGTIVNDDFLTFSVDSPSVTEGAAGTRATLLFTVTASVPASSATDVAWTTTASGTATAGADFEAASGTVAFAAGDTSATFGVAVIGDGAIEPDETVGVALLDPGTRSVTGTGAGTIRNDDFPTATLVAPSVDEGDAGDTTELVFTVRLDAAPAPGQDVELRYQVVTDSGTATISADDVRDPGEDYRDPDGYIPVIFTSGGPLEDTFIVEVWGDGAIEADETVVFANTFAANVVGTATGTGVIRNDDFPEVSIDSPEVNEGPAGATSSLTFTVSLSATSFAEATVAWEVTGGTAMSGTDYQATAGGTVAIPAGAASTTVTVTVRGDDVVEPDDKTVEVTLSNPNGATLRAGGETGTGVIRDDDLPVLTIDSPTVVEGDAGETLMTFRLSLSDPAPAPVVGDWTVTGGTAASGTDYLSDGGGRFGIAMNGTSTTVQAVRVRGDEEIEPDETVEITLSNLTGTAIFPGVAATLAGTGTIRNDDFPKLSIDSPSVEEGDSGTTDLVFTVELSQAASGSVTASWAVTGGTAEDPGDYTLPAGRTLTIPAGATTTAITATVSGDLDVEQNETVEILLSNVSAGAEPGTATGTGTIVNDDFLTFLMHPASVTEGASGTTATLLFTVTTSVPPPSAAEVAWRTTEFGTARAGEDFEAASGTVAFAAGATSATIGVTVIGDDALEVDETMEVTLLEPDGSRAPLPDGRATGTILNDDFPVASISSPSVDEGDEGTTDLVFTVRLDEAPVPGQDVLLHYRVSTESGTATIGSSFRRDPADADYQDPSTFFPVTFFSGGPLESTFAVEVWGDEEIEPDETVVVENIFAANAVGAGTGTGVIRNDDFPGLSIDSPSVVEGDSGTTDLVFTVTRVEATGTPVTVDWAVTGGTAEDPGDYTLPPGRTLTIPAGATTTTVTVTVNGDLAVERDETVAITLSNVSAGTSLRTATGTGTIVNDDMLSIDSPSVAEGASGATATLLFTVTASGPQPAATEVGWRTTASGTATAGVDFEAASGTVAFAAGDASATFGVTVIGDGAIEPHETVEVALLDSNGARIRTAGGAGTGTITNDDFPTATLVSPSVDEGDSGETFLTFTVRLDEAPPPDQDVELRYQVVTDSGTATISADSIRHRGEDYRDPEGYLLVPFTSSGSLEDRLIIRVWGDREIEPDETVVLANTLAVNVVVGTATGTGVIRNDDFPEVSIDSPSVQEGAAGATSSLTFTVSLSASSFGEAAVDWAVTGGTAMSGADYQATAGGTVTIAAGATSTAIPVTVTGDGALESNETVEITLSNPRGATFPGGAATATGTGTILDDDLPLITIDSPAVDEGDAGDVTTMTFRVSIDADPGSSVQLDWETTGGTAASGTDYRRNSGSIDFQPGGSRTQDIPILIDGDELGEPDETVVVTLSNLTGSARFPNSAATLAGTGTILNDDLPELSIDSPSVNEGDSGTTDLVFTVTLSEATSTPVTADWAVTGGTAEEPGDYTLPAGRTLTVPANAATTTITVTVNGDTEAERDETVMIALSNPSAGAQLGAATGTGTIVNDDAPPMFSVDSPSVAEGASGTTTTLLFTVTAPGPVASATEVTWRTTASSTATAGTDFEAASGTVAFAPGDATATFGVTVIGDGVIEPDETVEVTVQDPTAARLGVVNDRGTGAIRNDDFPTATLISPSVDEGDSGLTDLVFTVRLDQAPAPGYDALLRYQVVTESGTATIGDATRGPGEDYIDPTDRFLVPFTSGGSLEETFIIRVWSDGEIEPDETVVVANTSAVNVAGTATGTAVIRNDDFPEISIDSPEVNEGDTGATSSLAFTVSLSAPSFGETAVDWAVTDGTAAAGADYQAAATGTATIPAGATSTAIPIAVIGDDTLEPDRTVVITLSNPRGGTLRAGGETGTGTIRDDDTPVLSIDSPSVTEGDAGDTPTMSFRVSADPAPGENLTFAWAATGGTATRGTDYTAASGSATILSGSSSTVIQAVQVQGDGLPERDETVEITLSNLTGTAFFSGGGTTLTGTGTILDDDLPEVSVSAPTQVSEGGPTDTSPLVFEVALSAPSPFDVTVTYGLTGDATPGVDYQAAATTGPLMIPAGSTSTTVEVTVRGDDLVEPDETVTLTLSNPTGGVVRAGGTATVTILNDDLPVIGIDATSVREGDSGTTDLVFTVTKFPGTAFVTGTVDYAVTGGTATAGADYATLAAGTLRIPPASSTATIAVGVRGDRLGEVDETVEITLSNPGELAFTGSATSLPATGTITDDDDLTLAVGGPPAPVDEGDSGTTLLPFTLTLDAPSSRAVTVDWALTGEADAADFAAVSGTFTVPAGSTSTTLGIQVAGDTTVELDEAVALTLSNLNSDGVSVGFDGGGASLAASATIRNDDLPTFSVDPSSVAEGRAGTRRVLLFTVRADGPVSSLTELTWTTTASGTATAGQDFVAATGTVAFAFGDTSGTFGVTVIGDDVYEDDEVMEVEVLSPGTTTPVTGRGTIRNDEALPRITFDSPSVTEGDAGDTPNLVFTATMVPVSDRAVTVRWEVATSSGTATHPGDTQDTLDGNAEQTFAPGERTKMFTVPVNGDGEVEPDETVAIHVIEVIGDARLATSTSTFTAAAPGAALSPGTRLLATGTIVDDEPRVSIGSQLVLEGASGTTFQVPLRFTLTRSYGSDIEVTYRLATDAGTAMVDVPPVATGTDLSWSSSGAFRTLTFMAGSTEETVMVTIHGDDTREGDEVVVFEITAVSTGAGIGTATGTITILDDDLPRVTVDSPSVVEGDSGTTDLTFMVSMSGTSSVPVEVDWGLAGGTAEPDDYTLPAGSRVTIPPGLTTAAITVRVNGDLDVERDETVVIRLLGVSAEAQLGTPPVGTGTIMNDDAPRFSVAAPAPVGEGAAGAMGTMTFRVMLDRPSYQAVTVDWGVLASSTALAGTDFRTTGGTLTVAAGATEAEAVVMVLGDDIDEDDETVVIGLSSASGAALATGEATGTIRDDDFPSLVSITGSSTTEGAEGSTTTLAFTISLDRPSGKEVTVAFGEDFNTTAQARAIGDPREAGDDFESRYPSSALGRHTFRPGETAHVVEYVVYGDDRVEENEEVHLSFAELPVNANVGGFSASGIIVNDDFATISVTPAETVEGDSGRRPLVFTLSVDSVTDLDVSIRHEVLAGTGATLADGDFAAPAAAPSRIPAGSTSTTFVLQVEGDGRPEPDETVTVRFTVEDPPRPSATERGPIAFPGGSASADAIGTIRNDDFPVLTVDSPVVDEGDTGDTTPLGITVTLEPATYREVTVDWQATGGTFEAGDWEGGRSAGGRVTFRRGETSQTLVVGRIRGDDVGEDDDTVTVLFTNLTGEATFQDPNATSTETTATIRNDDFPEITVDSPSVLEGASTTMPMRKFKFTVTLDPVSDRQVTVDWRGSGGTADEGTGPLDDYTFDSPPGTLVFPAGTASTTIGVTVNGDDEPEPNETVGIVLENLTPTDGHVRFRHGANTLQGTGTILNDDSITLSVVAPADLDEGDTGTKEFTFTVELSAEAVAPVSVDYQVSGTTDSRDFAQQPRRSGTLDFPLNATSTTLSFEVRGDGVAERHETVTVTILNLRSAVPEDFTLGTASGTAMILNDDFPELTVNSPAVDEGDEGTTDLVFRLRLDRPSYEDVTVGYAVTGGTAASGTDYVPTPAGRVTIRRGAREATVRLPVRGDAAVENDETVTLTLSDLAGGAARFPNMATTLDATGTIRNDDIPLFSIAGTSTPEGAQGSTTTLAFTVSLDPAATGTATVDWAVTGGTALSTGAEADYTGTRQGTLTFPPGGAPQTIRFEVTGDDRGEPDETVTVGLLNPTGGARIATSTGTGRILNDDLPELVEVTDAPPVDEGDVNGGGTLVFVVVRELLEGLEEEGWTYGYEVATASSTATAGIDFPAATGTLVFAGGVAEGRIEFPVSGDDIHEDDETVTIRITNPVNGRTLATTTGTILNDDRNIPGITIDAADREGVKEPGAGSSTTLAFDVRLSTPSSATVAVDWAVTGGTATAGDDFEGPPAATVSFAPGATSVPIVFTVIGDDVAEPDETIVITLSNAFGAEIRKAEATGVIRDVPVLSLAGSPDAYEGATGTPALVFEARLSATSSEDVRFAWAVTGGTAEPDDDLATGAARGSGTIAAGALSEPIRVPVRRDVDEDDETVEITLSSTSSAAVLPVGGATALGTIVDADGGLSIGIDDPPTVTEGDPMNPHLVFTVTLSAPASASLTVPYVISADEGEYMGAATGAVVILAGRTSAQIRIEIMDDGYGETEDTVTVLLGAPTAATGTEVVAVRKAAGTGRVKDDDADDPTATPTVSVDAGGVKDGLERFVVNVLPALGSELEIGYQVEGGTVDSVQVRGLARAVGVNSSYRIPANRRGAEFLVRPDAGAQAVSFTVRLAPTSGVQLNENEKTATQTVTRNVTRPTARALGHILAGIGRTIATNIVDLVWDRAENHRSGVNEIRATVGGRRIDTGASADGGDGALLRSAVGLAGDLLGLDTDPDALLRNAERRLARGGGLGALRDWADLPDGRDLAGRTDFAVSFGNGEDGGPAPYTFWFWGRGNLTSFESDGPGDGALGDFSADGEVIAGHLVLDYLFREDLLGGVAVSHTVGDVDYGFGGGGVRGGVKTELTGAHPYLHWMSPTGLGVWGTLGYGIGTAEIEEEGRTDVVETDLAMEMAAFGVRGELGQRRDIDLAVKGDAFMAGISADEAGGIDAVDSDAFRARVALEGSAERMLPRGRLLAGRFELGARLDGGDAEKGLGADLVAEADYIVPRLGLEVRGRGSLLLVHEESGFREWGLGLRLSWDPGIVGRGMWFSVEPTWNAPTAGGAAAMWDAGPGGGAGPASARGASLDARLGYGMGAFGDRALATVFGELGRADGDARLRLGAGLGRPGAGGGGPGLELYGERRDRATGPERSIFLKGRLGF